MGSFGGQYCFIMGSAHNFASSSEAVIIWLFFNKLRPVTGKSVKAILAKEIYHFLNAICSA